MAGQRIGVGGVPAKLARDESGLRAAEQLVAAEADQDFELVIVDDNSPDETASIIARYDDPRIRFFRNPRNLGPEGNWNRCLEEAKGRHFIRRDKRQGIADGQGTPGPTDPVDVVLGDHRQFEVDDVRLRICPGVHWV